MRQSLAYLAVICSILAICANITKVMGETLLPDENIGVLSANIKAPAKQDIEENITITTSIRVASKCWTPADGVGLETTLTLPKNVSLLEGGSSSTFEKTVHLKLEVANQQQSLTVVVNRTDGSFTFRMVVDLLPYDALRGTREYYIFSAVWHTKAESAGDFTVSVRAALDHSDVYEPCRSAQETATVTIVKGAPTINSVDVLGRSYSPGLNESEWYVPTGKDVEVRCSVTHPIRVHNVTLYYSVWPSGNWLSNVMTNEPLDDVWVGFIPEQQEGTLTLFYVEAFSSTESAIEMSRLCRFLDLKTLEHRARLDVAATFSVVLVGCLIFFAVRKRRMSEL